ncbi:MAG: HD-GYP domain-containing protein [Candidatus Aureabacteria bacterium]|nr:HD-GYP domain-containing protein [Candidatus Auribacterota bacterium]
MAKKQDQDNVKYTLPKEVHTKLVDGYNSLKAEIVRSYDQSKIYARELNDALKAMKVGDQQLKQASSMMGRVRQQSLIYAKELQLAHQQIERSSLNTLGVLAEALDARDHYTSGHSSRVTESSVQIAKTMNLSHKEVEIIRQAGLLHDIGKIGIRDGVLLKPGKLTEEEYDLIKQHPIKGYKMLKGLSFLENALDCILYHHEQYNGSGFPEGLRAENIPIGARIIHVADTVDAMTTERPYRKALGLDMAIAELKKFKGILFDSAVVNAFLINCKAS